MIYSQWRPDTGGYDYFDDGVPQNINDDLPTPDLPRGTEIGVPSVEAGRAIPRAAVWVGEGDIAVGAIAPIDPARISRRSRSLGALSLPSGPAPWLALAAGITLGYVAYRSVRRR